jgi:myo-inositol-hexaphosphate 3-phosphohydrolase
VKHDSDDPALWLNPADPAESLILGTDEDGYGALYAFDLDGRTVKVTATLHRLKVVETRTDDRDGSDVTSAALGRRFPNDLFLAMSKDRTFQLYSWADLAGRDLRIAPASVSVARER